MNHLLDWRILLAFWFISRILESISFILSGKLFYLLFNNLFLNTFEFAEPLIFMCSFPFLGYFSASKSFIPTTISEILSVDPRLIASSSMASLPIPNHSSPLIPFAWKFFMIYTIYVFSSLSQRPSEPMTIKSWS